LIRKCGSVLAGNKPKPIGFECRLFEDTSTPGVEGLVGVSAIQTTDGVCTEPLPHTPSTPPR
jgi:hypothetical protein